ncbi:hypothetical protein [Synechococcus sp. CBW1004]|uniref:hypothetical protein n=1 Tax=Synechococcus sp. CBW1004 TaxID=1353136 RepID=UPI0018CCD6D5|nr:hypothetical protein [Synechococcus sp. CBW1004]QPN61999.1 hypothetical protein H8F25_09325 [Synechococcus sp. CBW1004]
MALNRLIDAMTTLMLAEHDAETRFRLRAARGAGRRQRALEVLDQAAQGGDQSSVQSSGG